MKKRLLALFLTLVLLTVPAAAAGVTANGSNLMFLDDVGATITIELSAPVLDAYFEDDVAICKVPSGTRMINPPEAAQIRAQEITTVFSHQRPDGSDCYTVLEETGANAGTYYAGENIAAGNATAAATVEQWMNSPGHGNNILNPNYTHLGVGYVNTPGGYRHYWVQMFVGR